MKKDNNATLKLVAGHVRSFISSYTILIETLNEIFGSDESLKKELLSKMCRETINPQEVAELIFSSLLSLEQSGELTGQVVENVIESHVEDMFAPLHTVLIRFVDEKEADEQLSSMIQEVHAMVREALTSAEDESPDGEVN